METKLENPDTTLLDEFDFGIEVEEPETPETDSEEPELKAPEVDAATHAKLSELAAKPAEFARILADVAIRAKADGKDFRSNVEKLYKVIRINLTTLADGEFTAFVYLVFCKLTKEQRKVSELKKLSAAFGKWYESGGRAATLKAEWYGKNGLRKWYTAATEGALVKAKRAFGDVLNLKWSVRKDDPNKADNELKQLAFLETLTEQLRVSIETKAEVKVTSAKK